ncbi:MmpS family transport accessory protein [Mycobacterium sp. 050128]|uniref:MmpS family transport accessory protein n=1 Tax=Mycobacterium sp. 050128 TaxID=3096112 RepID=UPI002EDBA433
MWIPLVIVAVVAVVGLAVYRVRGIFGVDPRPPAVSAMSDDTKPFNPKQVTYEVFGVTGAITTVNYLDVDAQPQQILNTTIPWSLSVTTTAPSVSVNVVAQSDEDFIGCRIIVNGVVKDERAIHGVKAQTYCLVKSA